MRRRGHHNKRQLRDEGQDVHVRVDAHKAARGWMERQRCNWAMGDVIQLHTMRETVNVVVDAVHLANDGGDAILFPQVPEL